MRSSAGDAGLINQLSGEVQYQPADHIMPEVYLYTVVQSYSMYDEMRQLV